MHLQQATLISGVSALPTTSSPETIPLS